MRHRPGPDDYPATAKGEPRHLLATPVRESEFLLAQGEDDAYWRALERSFKLCGAIALANPGWFHIVRLNTAVVSEVRRDG